MAQRQGWFMHDDRGDDAAGGGGRGGGGRRRGGGPAGDGGARGSPAGGAGGGLRGSPMGGGGPAMQQQQQQQQQQRQRHHEESHAAALAAAPLGVAPSPAAALPPPPGPPGAHDRVWEYRDPAGNVQGPFTAKELLTWHANAWFDDTLVLRACGAYWTTLSLLLDDLKARARAPIEAGEGGRRRARGFRSFSVGEARARRRCLHGDGRRQER